MKPVNKGILDTLAKVAAANPGLREKFAAAVVYRNRIISVGMNSMKSHPMQAKYSKNEHAVYLHSEIDSIKNALREIDIDDFSKCDLYVVRVKKPKPFSKQYITGLAKPCCGCERAIIAFGIRRVIYTDNEGGYKVEEY